MQIPQPAVCRLGDDSSSGIGAEYIYNGILVPFELGHKFCRQILGFVYLLLVTEWLNSSQFYCI